MALSPSGSAVITPDTSSPQSPGACPSYRSTTSARVGSRAGCFAASGAGVGSGPAVGAAAASAGPSAGVASGTADGIAEAPEAEPAGGSRGESAPDDLVRHPVSAPPATTMSSVRRLTDTSVSHPH
ncbi:hypothetical protein ACIQI7_26700 [Kitasatospora sp. NPDC092039]|uniref:hypothetical protein n=1 Tax=Kitasatospora sp. NPDC092039 TaxID=3364086 RepID=UPI0038294AA8